MFDKKVDIIMPNYNKSEFLNEAINSVLSQSYKNWKLYIIDDHSSDNSSRILKKYRKNKKIKIFFLEKNRGPSFCRNFGLKKSNSKFIAFLDSDDYWKKNKLKNQINFMIKKNYPFTFTDYIPILQTKNYEKILKRTNIVDTFNFQSFIKNSSINTSTMIIDRKYLRNLRFRNLDLLEDYVFKCELMKKTKINFKKFSDASAVYRIIKKSRSSKKISNICNLWRFNKIYNKLGFLQNLSSIFFISFNSFKKYGFK
jgi:teichuronic acid biosynthesis glycosyltransferase TuaG